jgi:hypothetical protein
MYLGGTVEGKENGKERRKGNGLRHTTGFEGVLI